MSEAFRNMRLKILAVSLAVQDCLRHLPEIIREFRELHFASGSPDDHIVETRNASKLHAVPQEEQNGAVHGRALVAVSKDVSAGYGD